MGSKHNIEEDKESKLSDTSLTSMKESKYNEEALQCELSTSTMLLSTAVEDLGPE